MQEVQKTLDYKAELNLIEWVWHQENRVKEHSQVEAAFGYECSSSCSITHHYEPNSQSPTVQGTLTISDSRGNTEFKAVNKWIRIPLAWPYLVNVSFRWWSSSNTVTSYLRVWEQAVYQVNTTSSTWASKEMVLNLGKYDVISVRGTVYHSWSWSWSFNSDATINIKRL